MTNPSPQAQVYVLYPPLASSARRADDRALVLRLDLGVFKVLWCNDAGFLAEKTILETWPEAALHCDVLIRNQHAGDFSLLPEFLDAVKPRLVISSHQNFPADEKLPERIVRDCAKRNIRLLDQSETGAVTLKFHPQQLEVAGFRGPRFTLPAGNP
jgi:beta-lactamase superfamily II metal-dependent hydrolase